MTPDRVREIQRIAQDPLSLDSPVGEEDDSNLADFIEDPRPRRPPRWPPGACSAAAVDEALDELNEREQAGRAAALRARATARPAPSRRWARSSASPASASARSSPRRSPSSATPSAARSSRSTSTPSSAPPTSHHPLVTMDAWGIGDGSPIENEPGHCGPRRGRCRASPRRSAPAAVRCPSGCATSRSCPGPRTRGASAGPEPAAAGQAGPDRAVAVRRARPHRPAERAGVPRGRGGPVRRRGSEDAMARLQFANTDPRMILFFVTWLRRFFDGRRATAASSPLPARGLDLEAADRVLVRRSPGCPPRSSTSRTGRRLDPEHPTAQASRTGCPAVRYALQPHPPSDHGDGGARCYRRTSSSGVAQSAEQRTVKPMVVGSSPTPGAGRAGSSSRAGP